MNGSLVTLAAEVWNVPAVIDVCVRKDESIDLRRLEGEVQVAFVTLAPPSLEEPAFEENFLAVYCDQMLRAGDGSRAAVKFDLQAVCSLISESVKVSADVVWKDHT